MSVSSIAEGKNGKADPGHGAGLQRRDEAHGTIGDVSIAGRGSNDQDETETVKLGRQDCLERGKRNLLAAMPVWLA